MWWYFITICVKDREKCLWNIVDWKIYLNEYWKIVENEIMDIKNFWKDIVVDQFVIMPDHIHLILFCDRDNSWCDRDNSWIVSTGKNKNFINNKGINDNGINDNGINDNGINDRDNSWIVSTDDINNIDINNQNNIKLRRKMIIPIVIWKLKMIISKQINLIKNTQWKPFWQANYYDHIIKNDIDLQRIRKYVFENPMKWEDDLNNISNYMF